MDGRSRLAVGRGAIELVAGDITTERVDAIVNAANAALAGGGGVDGAIHAAAGLDVMRQLRREHAHGTPTGTAVATDAGRLAARWIIHAVGPRYRDGSHGEADALAAAYRNSLALAEGLGARSVAFPAISLGIYGYPAEAGARVALGTVVEHLRGDSRLELVRFVLRGRLLEVFSAALEEVA